MSKPEQHRCEAQVRDMSMRFPRYHQCRHNAVKKEGDKWVCNLHTLDSIQTRKATVEARRTDQYNKFKHQVDCRIACQGMKNPVAEVAALKLLAGAAQAFEAYDCSPRSGDSKDFILVEKSEVIAIQEALNSLKDAK